MPVGPAPQIAQTAALRSFYEVAQRGPFGAAGAVPVIAPSTVHQRIKLLETELGSELFDWPPRRGSCRTLEPEAGTP